MKKLMAITLSALMLTSTVITGCAAESDAWKSNTGTVNLDKMTVTGNGISISGNVVKIVSGGDFEVTGTLSDGMIYINSEEKVKLRLSGADITNSTGPAIFFDNAEKGFITITENTKNTLTDGKEYTVEEADAVLFSNDDLEIEGDGTLTVNGNFKYGIASDDDLKMENGKITVNSNEHGIKVNDTLSVLGGEITVNAQTGKGMKAELGLVIDAGTININTPENEGIESKGILTVNGGEINIVAGEDGMNTGNPDTTTTEETTETTMPTPPEGMGERPMRGQRPENGEMPTPPEGMDKRPMRGQKPENGEMPTPPEGMGERPMRGQKPENGEMPTPPEGMGERPMGGGFGGGFGRLDEETAAAHAVTINGGKIHIIANGDGIDSNGNLTISGGEVIIDGPVSAGNGPLDSDGTMSITGGTVVCTSGAGMLQLPRNAENQNILRASFENQEAGTTVSVKENESGEEILSVTPTLSWQALIFSSEKLVTDKSYTVYLNGEEAETVTIKAGTTLAGKNGFGGNRDMGKMPGRGGFERNVKVKVNDKDIKFDTQPVIKNGTTLVGFRAILEALGAEVSWEEETQTVTATKDATKIVLNIGSSTAYVNGEEYTLLLAPEIIGNSTMIPVRFVSEQMGMDVGWDEATQLITVNSK